MLNAQFAQLVRNELQSIANAGEVITPKEIRARLRKLLVSNGADKLVVTNPDCIFNSTAKVDADLRSWRLAPETNLFNRMTAKWTGGETKEAVVVVSNRSQYPDGRGIPQEGDKVYQKVPGLDGAAQTIEGQVVLANGKMRVAVEAGTLNNSARSYPLNSHWTVVGDPEIERRKAESGIKA